MEGNKYCSTFIINISSLIHSMNIFICLQAKIYRYPIDKIWSFCFKITYLMTNQSFLGTFKHNIILIKKTYIMPLWKEAFSRLDVSADSMEK